MTTTKQTPRKVCFTLGSLFILTYSALQLLIVGADQRHEKSKYFQEQPSTFAGNILKTYTGTSHLHCALRCKRNKECVDVAFRDDKACLLLGKAIHEAPRNVTVSGLTRFAAVELPGV